MTLDRSLRRLLAADGVICLGLALLCLLADDRLAGLLLPGRAAVLTVPADLAVFEFGTLSAGYGALLLALAAQAGVSVGFVAATAVADALSVAVILALLFVAGAIASAAGTVLLLVLAGLTLLLGLLKLRGLREAWRLAAVEEEPAGESIHV